MTSRLFRISILLASALFAAPFGAQADDASTSGATSTAQPGGEKEWFRVFDWRQELTDLQSKGGATWASGSQLDPDAGHSKGLFVAVVDKDCIHSESKMKVFWDAYKAHQGSPNQFAIVIHGDLTPEEKATLPATIPVLNVPKQTELPRNLSKSFPNFVYLNAYDQVYFRGDQDGVKYSQNKVWAPVSSLPADWTSKDNSQHNKGNGKYEFTGADGSVQKYWVPDPKNGKVLMESTATALAQPSATELDNAFKANDTVLSSVGEKGSQSDLSQLAESKRVADEEHAQLAAQKNKLDLAQKSAKDLLKKVDSGSSLKLEGDDQDRFLRTLGSTEPMNEDLAKHECLAKHAEAVKTGYTQAFDGRYFIASLFRPTQYKTGNESPVNPDQRACRGLDGDEAICCYDTFVRAIAAVKGMVSKRKDFGSADSKNPIDQECLKAKAAGAADAHFYCTEQRAGRCTPLTTGLLACAGWYHWGFQEAKEHDAECSSNYEASQLQQLIKQTARADKPQGEAPPIDYTKFANATPVIGAK